MPDPAATLADDASTIGVVDDAGHVSLIPASQALHLGEGFHLASPAQLSILHSQQEQAGLLGALKAAGQSAADTATLGGASWLETATGLRTPEAIEAGAAAHPVSSFLGSAVGVAAPLGAEKLVAGRLGEGLLSKVAGGAPGLISDIGEATQGAVRAAAPGKLGRITTEALAHGAGSAVEGAAYGLGQSVAEDALDPNLTVESAMARGGTSALLGAGLGAAIGVPLGLVSSVVGKVSSAELADRLEGFAAERDLKGTGGNVGKLVEKKGREEAIQLSREARDLGIFGRYNSAEDINAKASALLDDTGKAQRAFADRVDAATAGKPNLQADARKVLKELQTAVVDLQKDPFQEAAGRTLQGYADRLQAQIDAAGPAGRLPLSDLWELRKYADRAIRWDAAPGPSAVKDTLRDLRKTISQEMDDAIARAGEDTAAWKKLNRTYSVAAEMKKLSAQGIKKAVGAAPISFGESVATLAGFVHGGPAGVVLPLAYAGARRYGGDVLGMAARGAAGALKGTGGAIPAVADAAASVATAGAVDVTEGIRAQRDRVAALAALERTARDVVQDSREAMTDLVAKGRNQRSPAAPSSADILKVVKSVNELGNRPQNAADLVASMTSETHEHAPSMTMKTGEIAGRALAYLTKNAPQIAKPFPFGPEIVPDRSVLLAFNEKVEALKDPIGTLARGPSKLAVEAITAVYPTLMQHAREALIGALAHAGPDKVYSPAQRAQFSAVLGVDLDGTNSPQLSAVSQAAFLASSTPTPHHGAGGRRSLKTKTLSERYSPRGGGSLRNP